jgi:uncharacterized repeat protein (TIGR01451 family)
MSSAARRRPRTAAVTSVLLLLMLMFGVTAQAGSPIVELSATKTAAFLLDDNSDGKADPGDKIRYTVTIENPTGVRADNLNFTDTVDSNTMLVNGSFKSTPVAANDEYRTIGNVGITVPAANGVLANDLDPDGGAISATPGAGATAQGGAYALAADGSFSYTPKPGYEGFDSFSYTITDADSNTDTATVTIIVSDVIWFIDTNAGSNGNGTLNSPFNTPASLGPAADEAGDIIFLYSSATPYSGGLTLLSSQILIGQGATSSITTIANINMALYPYSNDLPATGGSRPTLTNPSSHGIILNANNQIHGVTVGNTLGIGIYGTTNAEDLTIRDTNITGTGAGINLTSGALMDIQLDGLQTSNANAPAVRLLSVSGTFDLTGTDNTAGVGYGVTAIEVVGNSSIEPVVNMTFKSVNTSGAYYAVQLYETAPTSSLTVTGDGSTAGSGGTISNATYGFYIQYVHNISLNWMAIQNSTYEGIWAQGVGGLTLANVAMNNNGTGGNGNSIYLLDNFGEIAITNSTISNSGIMGIRLHQDTASLDKLTISGTTIDGAPQQGFSAVVTGANNAAFKVTGSSIIKNIASAGILIANQGSGTVTTVVENSTLQNNGIGAQLGLNGTGRLDFNIANNTMSPNSTAAIIVDTGSTTTTASLMNGFIINNQIGDANANSAANSFFAAIRVNHSGGARLIASIADNTIQNAKAAPIAVFAGTDNVATAGVDLTLDNNTAVPTGSAIDLKADNQTTLCANITDNKVTSSTFSDYFLRQQSAATFALQGYATSAAATLAANGNTRADLSAATVSAIGTFVAPGAPCATPAAVSIAATTAPRPAVAAAPAATSDLMAQMLGSKPLFSRIAAPARIDTRSVADLDVTIPQFDPSQTVTFTFDVMVRDPLTGNPATICNQGSVSADSFPPLLTDDPAVGGSADPTCVPAGSVAPPTTGTITIVKDANPADGTTFNFTDDIEAPNAFALSSTTTLTQTFSSVPTGGSYTVTETDTPGWPLTDLQCSYDLSTVTPNLSNNQVVIGDLDAGDTVICTFTNTQCQPGQYDAGGNACVPAPAGSFVDQPGATQPTQCAPGTWQDQEGAISCKQADPGFFVPTPGATEQTQCPQGTTSEAGAIECTPIQSAGFCPVGPGVDTLRTDLIGIGQRGRIARLTVPQYNAVETLYGQMAGVDIGTIRWVQFVQKGEPQIKVSDPTSPAVVPGTVRWWGSELAADADKPWVKGIYSFGPRGNRAPRAFVLWPTYDTGDEAYANAFETFDSPDNYVHQSTISQTLSLPPTAVAGADVAVNVALVDVNYDRRVVILTVEAGGVSETRTINRPNRRNVLNIEKFSLRGVAVGTDEVTITLESPPVGGQYPFGGDSAGMIGASANYACGELSPP